MTIHRLAPSVRRVMPVVTGLLSVTVLLSCAACTTSDPSPTNTPSATSPPRFFGCPDGHQGSASPSDGRGAFGVVLTGTKGAAPTPLPPADGAGVKTEVLPTALFWKAPLAVSSPADIVLTIKPPHYLAYVPGTVWANSPGGVRIDPWVTRELHISPCPDGAPQSYLGGLLVDPAQPCIDIEIEATRDGHARRSALRLGPTTC